MDIDTGQSSKDAGKELLESILRNGIASTSSDAANLASTYFSTRVEGKKLALANLDRSRPIPKSHTIAHRQIQRRDERLLKKTRSQAIYSNEDKGKRKEEDDQKKPFSRRKRKRLGLEDIDENLSYEIMTPIHRLWVEYIHRLIGLIDENGRVLSNQFQVSRDYQNGESLEVSLNSNNITAFQTSLVKADFCGASIRVTRALNPSLVGIEGLVARESESTFIIVTKSLHAQAKKSKKLVKTIPKKGSIFSLQIPLPLGAIPTVSPMQLFTLSVPLYGNQLCNTMQTRATKKFKARKTIDL